MAGAYGTIPTAIGMPASTWEETQGIPGMSGLTSAAMGAMGTQISGQLSPENMAQLQDKAAAFGIGKTSSPFTGSPNVSLANYLESIGLSSEQLTQQGLGNYSNFLGQAGQQQLDPSLATSINETNSIWASAPDPASAVLAEQNWIQQYMKMMNPASGQSSGGYAPVAGMPNLGGRSTSTQPSAGTSGGYTGGNFQNGLWYGNGLGYNGTGSAVGASNPWEYNGGTVASPMGTSGGVNPYLDPYAGTGFGAGGDLSSLVGTGIG